MKRVLLLLAFFLALCPAALQAQERPASSARNAAPAPAAAEAAPAVAPARAEVAPLRSTSLFDLMRQGGWAMYPLAFLSVIAVMLILVYAFTLRRGAILSHHYMNTADVLLKKRDQLGLLAISARHTEVVARIMQRTLDFATKNPGAPLEVLQDIAATEGSAQAAALQHRVTYLADIGVLAPMIGLLGTVWGIIDAFGTLGNKTSMSRDSLVATGVSEALVATGSGLILGILAMGFYAVFRNRVHALISDMEIATTHLMALIAIQARKKPAGGRSEGVAPSRISVEEEY